MKRALVLIVVLVPLLAACSVRVNPVMSVQASYSADDCKNGGWQRLSRTDGSGFKNQGDCVSYVQTGR